jgi:hypothetical protein
VGRTEKTGHSGTAKNPRLLKACNTTEKSDMGEFFFISMSMKMSVKIPRQRAILIKARGLEFKITAKKDK